MLEFFLHLFVLIRRIIDCVFRHAIWLYKGNVVVFFSCKCERRLMKNNNFLRTEKTNTMKKPKTFLNAGAYLQYLLNQYTFFSMVVDCGFRVFKRPREPRKIYSAYQYEEHIFFALFIVYFIVFGLNVINYLCIIALIYVGYLYIYFFCWFPVP